MRCFIGNMGNRTMLKICVTAVAEIRQTGNSGLPFVGLERPFVGSREPDIEPSVGVKRPLVPQSGKSQGFTLIELITTLVVAAILLALAVPNMSAFIQRDRLLTQANELVADLSFARSEAVKRGRPVIVCKQDPGNTAPACNTTAGDPWTPGRVIWFDNDGDSTVDANEVLRWREPLDGTASGGNRLFGDGSTTGTGVQIVFNGLGMANPPAANAQFVLCDKRGPTEAISIGIGPTGRAAVAPKGKNWDGTANLTAADCP